MIDWYKKVESEYKMRSFLLCLVAIIGFAPSMRVQRQTSEPLIPGFAFTVVWSPDSSKVAVATAQNGVWIFSQDRHVSIVNDPYLLTNIAWSPDSNHLAVLFEGGLIQIWAITNLATPKMLITFFDEGVRSETSEEIAWHPRENLLAVTGNGIRIWNPMDATLVRHIRTNQWVSSVVLEWSPDGTALLAALPYQNSLQIWDGMDGTLLHEIVFAVNPSGVLWGNDSQTIAVVQAGYPLYEMQFFHLSDTEEPFMNITNLGDMAVPDWNANTIASTVDVLDIYIWELSTQQVVKQLPGIGRTFALSPDGLQIAYIKEDQLKIEDIPIAPSVLALNVSIRGCLFSPDQTSLTWLTSLIETQQWNTFIENIEVQRGHTISEACAADLIEMAQYLHDNQ